MSNSRSRIDLRTWVAMAMLTAVAYVIMYLSKLLPSVNGFLDFDFKDVVICISGFIYGPVPAAIISIVVALIESVTISHTGPIGLLMNVLATCSFCCTATFVYKKRHTMWGAVLGLSLGIVALVAVMLLWNYLITPIYQGVPRDVVVAMLPTVFLPFNLAKGGLNMAATLLLYKPVVTALRKAHLVAPSQTSSQTKKLNVGFLLFSLALLATFVTLALVLWGII
jgi:riboflavin transporter FmnP